MNAKCLVCCEPLGLLSNASQNESSSGSFSFHQSCIEDIQRIKKENEHLKTERQGLRDCYESLTKSYSALDETYALKYRECQERETKLNELVMAQQTEKLKHEKSSQLMQENVDRVRFLEEKLTLVKGFKKKN